MTTRSGCEPLPPTLRLLRDCNWPDQDAGQLPAVEDCLFRMLEPHEILAGMAFARDYIVLGNRRERVAQAGNAVTPPAAEVIVSALVECITGEDVAA